MFFTVEKPGETPGALVAYLSLHVDQPGGETPGAVKTILVLQLSIIYVYFIMHTKGSSAK